MVWLYPRPCELSVWKWRPGVWISNGFARGHLQRGSGLQWRAWGVSSRLRVPEPPGGSRTALAVERWMVWALALVGPPVVTVALSRLGGQQQRDYVFIYLGLVAIVGVLRGLWPAL